MREFNDRFLAVIGWLAVLLVGLGIVGAIFAQIAQAAQEVCPEQGKVESIVDGDIDGYVPAAGVEICIKAGTDVVYVTADGESTVAELIGNGKNVSHYTEISWPTTTSTSTTTSIPTTTSTTPETTTTTPSTTSSTEAPTTTVPEATTTTVGVTTTVPEPELPFTGPEIPTWVLALIGMGLLGSGVAFLRSHRESA